MERYDPRHDKWTSVSSLDTPRGGACAVVLMGKIFVMGGGSDFRKILSSCEIYDPGADKWSYGKGKYCKTLRESQGRCQSQGPSDHTLYCHRKWLPAAV